MIHDHYSSADYQRMTNLPEELERGLLDVPMAILLVKCGILGASTKYSCVQRLARELSEKEIRALVEKRWTQDEIDEALVKLRQLPEAEQQPAQQARHAAQAPQESPAVKGISRVRAPRSQLHPTTSLKLLAGKTSIQAGSLREKVLNALRKRSPQTVEALTLALGFDVKPVVAKLRDAGWIEVES